MKKVQNYLQFLCLFKKTATTGDNSKNIYCFNKVNMTDKCLNDKCILFRKAKLIKALFKQL